MNMEELNRGNICPGCGMALGAKQIETTFQAYTQKLVTQVPLAFRTDVRVRHAGVWYCGKCAASFDTWSRRIVCSQCKKRMPANTAQKINGKLYCADCVQNIILHRYGQEEAEQVKAPIAWQDADRLQKIYEDYLSARKAHPYTTAMTLTEEEICFSTGPSYTAIIRSADGSFRVEIWDEPDRHDTYVISHSFGDEASAMQYFLRSVSGRAFTSFDFTDRQAHARIHQALSELINRDKEALPVLQSQTKHQTEAKLIPDKG